jgi:hypothetical protein
MVQEFEKFKRIEEIPKKYLKELYEESEKQLNAYVEQLKVVNKKIKNSEFENDEELNDFISKLKRVQEYDKFLKDKDVRDNILKFIDGYRKQRDDILKVCPEFNR